MNKRKYVLGFAFNKELDQVLLIKKNRPEWQNGYLNGIGGKIEDGENEFDAIVREFKEETTIDTNKSDWYKFAMIVGEDYETYCLYSTLSISKLNNAYGTDEEPICVDIRHVNGIDLKTIANTPALVHIARSQLIPNRVDQLNVAILLYVKTE